MSILLIEAITITCLDPQIANYFHKNALALQPFFHALQRFGLGYPYLVLSAIAFAALRWGGRVKKLRGWDMKMRAAARIPLFLFMAVAVSGITAAILKVV